MNSDAMKSILLLFIKSEAVTNLPPLRESRPEISGVSEVEEKGTEVIFQEMQHLLS